MEIPDVTDRAKGEVLIGERLDVTECAREKWVVRERRDVTDSARGKGSLGRDVILQSMKAERGRWG